MTSLSPKKSCFKMVPNWPLHSPTNAGRRRGGRVCTHGRLLVQRLQHPVFQGLEIPGTLVLHSFLTRFEELQAERVTED